MATDQGGKRGPQSSRPGGGYGHERFNRRSERGGGGGPGAADDAPSSTHADRDHQDSSASNPNASNVGVPPAVPGFGFSLPGMPMFPPGFMLGAGQQNPSTSTAPQPPPPGQGS